MGFPLNFRDFVTAVSSWDARVRSSGWSAESWLRWSSLKRDAVVASSFSMVGCICWTTAFVVELEVRSFGGKYDSAMVASFG